MNKKLKVSKVTHPEGRMDYHEWVEHYKFGKLYVEPPQLFQNNHYEPVRMPSTGAARIFSGIFKFLNKIG
jgi:hypothetical protein